MNRNLILTLASLVIGLFFALNMAAQTRVLPSVHSIAQGTGAAIKSPALNWDYYNDFQDTSSLGDMEVENVDGYNDNIMIGATLGLDFSSATWLLLHYTGESNYWAGSNSSFDTVAAADRWIITPSIIVTEYSTLNWKAQSVQIYTTSTSENYEIYISTTGGDSPADFTGAPVFTSGGEPINWTDHQISLSEYYGDTIYIAFRHTSLNQGILGLDDIRVGYVHDPADGMLGDFEDAEPFSQNLSPWTTLDLDSSLTYVFEGVSFPGSGEKMSFIAFNPAETNPSITGIDIWEGDQFGACFSAIAPPFGNSPNNDWLISPKSTIKENGTASFYARSFSHLWGWERFRVGVSTTNTEPSSFTILTPGSYVEVDTSWTKFEFDLSAYANQAVYFGINCVSDTAFVFCIDDIRIDSVGSVSIAETLFPEVEIFPNPTAEYLFVNHVEHFNIRLTDAMGREVYAIQSAGYKNRISTKSLKPGLYLLQISNGREQKSYKIQKI